MICCRAISCSCLLFCGYDTTTEKSKSEWIPLHPSYLLMQASLEDLFLRLKQEPESRVGPQPTIRASSVRNINSSSSHGQPCRLQDLVARFRPNLVVGYRQHVALGAAAQAGGGSLSGLCEGVVQAIAPVSSMQHGQLPYEEDSWESVKVRCCDHEHPYSQGIAGGLLLLLTVLNC